MKKKSWGKAALLILSAMVLLYAVWCVRQVGDHLQYVVEAPAVAASGADTASDTAGAAGSSAAAASSGAAGAARTKPNTAVAEVEKTLTDAAAEWDGIMTGWTMDGLIQQASLTADNGGTGQGRLTLTGENSLMLHPLYLRYGRLFYPEEMTGGDKVILLDEQLALTLFNISDPLERTVTLAGTGYKVVGITRHVKQVGDYTDAGAYIPLASVIDQPLQLDALKVEAAPVQGMGANVSFAAVVNAWRPGGTIIDLGKEAMGATLWLRALLFLIGMTLALRALRALNARVGLSLQDYRQRLQRQYASRLMPRLLGGALLYVAGYASLLAAVALLMDFIIKPVYTFPEWVPAILVEWKDIQTAFWKVWQTGATLREWRTPELLRLRFFANWIQIGAAACGTILALAYARLRGRRESAAESLVALFREGVDVSTVRTDRVLDFLDLGYTALWPEDEAAAEGKRRGRARRTMTRIINARSVLEHLPLSAREGSFVLDVTDGRIAGNNGRYLITCTGRAQTIEDAERDYDLRLSVEALTQLVYGSQSFHDFLEDHAGFDMKMRSPAMDGLFAHHLQVAGGEQ